MRRSSFYKFLILVIIMSSTISLSAQQVDEKLPWSVRMTESEMIRCPESWQLDFQPRLKWDYCHGLELGAMLDVYDTYGDKKIRDYAIAYADTMVHEDGSITAYKLTDYSLDRINSGKILFRIYEQTKDEKYKKALDLLYSQFAGQPRNEDGGFWHKRYIRIRCGWTDFIWELLFMQNMLSVIIARRIMQTSSISLSPVPVIRMIEEWSLSSCV